MTAYYMSEALKGRYLALHGSMFLAQEARTYDLDLLARGAISAPNSLDLAHNAQAVIRLVHLDEKSKRKDSLQSETWHKEGKGDCQLTIHH